MSREIVLAMVAMIAFGVSGVVFKKATGHIDTFSLTLCVYMFATVFTTLAYCFIPASYKIITREGIKWVALAAVFVVTGMVSYMSALKIGQASVVVPIRSLALVITVVLAVTLLGEQLSPIKVAGISFAIIALILLSVG